MPRNSQIVCRELPCDLRTPGRSTDRSVQRRVAIESERLRARRPECGGNRFQFVQIIAVHVACKAAWSLMVPLSVTEVCEVLMVALVEGQLPALAGITGMNYAIHRGCRAALRRLGIGLKSGVGACQQILHGLAPGRVGGGVKRAAQRDLVRRPKMIDAMALCSSLCNSASETPCNDAER